MAQKDILRRVPREDARCDEQVSPYGYPTTKSRYTDRYLQSTRKVHTYSRTSKQVASFRLNEIKQWRPESSSLSRISKKSRLGISRHRQPIVTRAWMSWERARRVERRQCQRDVRAVVYLHVVGAPSGRVFLVLPALRIRTVGRLRIFAQMIYRVY